MGAITAELVETGEKRDSRGRRVTPGARRAQLVEAYGKSGLTMAEFARREQLNYATFAGWVAKAQRAAGTGRAIEFAEVRLPFAPPNAGRGDPLEVRVPDGTVLRGGGVAEMAALIRALRS